MLNIDQKEWNPPPKRLFRGVSITSYRSPHKRSIRNAGVWDKRCVRVRPRLAAQLRVVVVRDFAKADRFELLARSSPGCWKSSGESELLLRSFVKPTVINRNQKARPSRESPQRSPMRRVARKNLHASACSQSRPTWQPPSIVRVDRRSTRRQLSRQTPAAVLTSGWLQRVAASRASAAISLITSSER